MPTYWDQKLYWVGLVCMISRIKGDPTVFLISRYWRIVCNLKLELDMFIEVVCHLIRERVEKDIIATPFVVHRNLVG